MFRREEQFVGGAAGDQLAPGLLGVVS
ncbi:hypothetical protein ABID19_006126 [Mesorhizobium robiniae]|uniref:Uncharacterized protein n=1 Tax=Mesorhizobium robiniae TaxID=559315 RepID=A0ABV2GXP7_9HYPH